MVVHERSDVHEIFSYNLYPGPSAKKGVYGALIELGEQQGWVTAHCSTGRVMTPYDNIVTFMHEGASGGGKSEMLQQPHRLRDGRLLMGHNTVTNETRYIEIPRTCDLFPVCDDMALCHPSIQTPDGKLSVADAESGWFVRVDHLREYGTDPDLEHLTVHPDQPLLFMNVEAVVGGAGLIWDHVEDAPGQPCPNPRVVVPPRLSPTWSTVACRSICGPSAYAPRRAPGRLRATASWECSMCFRRRWRGCGDWWLPASCCPGRSGTLAG